MPIHEPDGPGPQKPQWLFVRRYGSSVHQGEQSLIQTPTDTLLPRRWYIWALWPQPAQPPNWRDPVSSSDLILEALITVASPHMSEQWNQVISQCFESSIATETLTACHNPKTTHCGGQWKISVLWGKKWKHYLFSNMEEKKPNKIMFYASKERQAI